MKILNRDCETVIHNEGAEMAIVFKSDAERLEVARLITNMAPVEDGSSPRIILWAEKGGEAFMSDVCKSQGIENGL